MSKRFRPAGIAHVVRSINCTSHTSLPNRHSPAHIVFGRQSRLFATIEGPAPLALSDDDVGQAEDVVELEEETGSSAALLASGDQQSSDNSDFPGEPLAGVQGESLTDRH